MYNLPYYGKTICKTNLERMYFLKRLVGITGAIVMICLMINVFFAPVSSAENTSSQSMASIEQTDAEEVFIIKAENNRIVVYKKGEDKPYMLTDTPANNLPKGDIVYLEKGIEIIGREKLRKALEDFCS